MAFKLAQTFYIDKTTVRDAEHVTLSSIDLFFKSKPRDVANRSGIKEPGVSIYIVETRDDDVPDTTRVLETGFARNEYSQIIATSDASIKTKFSFAKPVIVKTNKSYAVAVSYDGDEDYLIWTCREGENIVGTNIVTSGATARNVGKYYEFSSIVDSTENLGSTIQEQWKPLNNVDLKFAIFVGVYAANTTATNINSTYILPGDPVEYILFDRYHYKTNGRANVNIGEMLFQETPVIYGPVVVNANSTLITTSGGINFSTLLTSSDNIEAGPASSTPTVNQKSYIVLRNGSGQSANVNVREVKQILSNTEIIVDRLPTFTNTVATFSVTAAAKLAYTGIHWYTGRWWDSENNVMDVYGGRRTDILRLTETNANSTVRFVNNMVEAITISSGGTGYSNADVVTVYPMTNANTANADHIRYIPSYANAVANVITNGSGTITGIGITNAGYGLSANAALTITTSAGTAANLQVLVGSTLRGEQSNAMFGNCVVTNVEVHRSFPHMHVLSNQHHSYRTFQHYPYYLTPGKEHLLQVSTPAAKREVETFINNDAFDFQSNDGRVYVIASRSNEAVQTANVSVVVANGATVATTVKSSSLLEVSISSNNSFSMPLVVSDDVYNYKYIINNSDESEYKGNGRALSRHVSKKVTFAENRTAEDVVVYLDAYRPTGTRIKVYARLHNKADGAAFDDKDWTELELKSNNETIVSSLTNDKDIIEYTYGLPTMPASYYNMVGDAQCTASSANVVGIGTSWTADLEVSDVVKVYSPLFPTNYMISVVKSITNSTFIELNDAVTDTNLTAGTMKIDIVGRASSDPTVPESGRPLSAWSNRPNSFVSRYYDSNMAKYDGYHSFAIKIVLLSENNSVVPKIENIRAVGVSA